MDPARWERIQELFHQALGLPDADREALLRSASVGDAELEAEVRALLEQDADAGSLLDRGLAEVAHEVLDGSVPLLRTIGPYRLVRVLGRGGMGVVYLAERDDLHSRVAIKVLRDASLSPFRRERFEREQQTLAQLTHPSIARLYDASVLADGTPYFVMEYVDGLPLTGYCAAHGCTVGQRLRLFREVCEAVHYAHRRAVIHRDLKPSNILVADDADDADGEAAIKLLDFGIAKQLESLETPADQTQAGLLLMTPAYAAPEQLRGEPVGVYTDVYALGRLLYELLTGRPPVELDGLTPGQAESRILASGPARPSVLARGSARSAADRRWAAGLTRAAWADLDVLCTTAMHPDPQRRYATVEALIRDLDHFHRGEPLEARPDTVGYRAGKFVRRNRQPVAAAGLMAGVVIATVAFYTVQLADQRDRARTEAAKAAQISEYLIGLFEAGDPYVAEPDNLDVRMLLERGERQAEALTDQPAVQAAMLNVLGRVYTRLSDYGRAEPLLRRALELRREDGDPLEVAESLGSLATLFGDMANFDSTEVVLREALAIRQQHLPANHAEIATNLGDLGVVLANKGQYRDAQALHGLALRIRRAIHDEPHEELGASLNRLAIVLYQQGEYAAAERYYREALAVNRAVFGAEHASVTRVMANLGKLYEELGEFAAADSLLSEALRIRRATLGDDHFETAIGLGQLGGMLVTAGEYGRAVRHLRESLAIRERILEPGHPSIGTTMNGLALALQLQGDYDGAESLFRRAVAIYRSGLGERHRFTGVALCNLGHLLFLKGELAAAQAELRGGVSILEEVHPAHHQELAHNRSRLGAVLAARARYAEAERLLLDGYRTLDAQLGSEHDRTRQAAERLVDLYEVWGKPDRAEPFRLALAVAG